MGEPLNNPFGKVVPVFIVKYEKIPFPPEGDISNVFLGENVKRGRGKRGRMLKNRKKEKRLMENINYKGKFLYQ